MWRSYIIWEVSNGFNPDSDFIIPILMQRRRLVSSFSCCIRLIRGFGLSWEIRAGRFWRNSSVFRHQVQPLSRYTNVCIVGSTAISTSENFVKIGEQKIELSTTLGWLSEYMTCTVHKLNQYPDATHLFSLWEAIEEYLFYKRDTQDLELLRCLAHLVALKNHHQACADRLLEDEPESDANAGSAHLVLSQRLWLASTDVASRVSRRRKILGLDLSSDNIDLSLFAWVSAQRHDTITVLLLEACDIIVGKDEIAVWSSLTVAASTSNIAALSFHLSDRGIDRTALSRFGPELVWNAAECGNVIVLGMLLKAGTLCEGSRILLNASYDGRDAIVNCFLQSGVQVDLDAALEKASTGNQETTVDILLQAGAHIKKDLVGLLIYRGLDSMADKLLQAGGDCESYALVWAVDKKFEGIVDKLLLFSTNWDLNPALASAVKHGHEGIVDKLLKAGANVDADVDNDCPLMSGIEHQHEAIVRRLLQAGPDLKRRFLSLAAESGQGEIVTLLLHAGANHMIDDALERAARKGDEEIVDILLEAGADINTSAALRGAVVCGRKSLVKRLIQAGANVTTDDIDSSPLVGAMYHRDEEIIAILLKAGASLGPLANSNSLTNIQSAINHWDPALVDLVLQEFAEAKPQRG